MTKRSVIADQLTFVRAGGLTTRFHIMSRIKPENVAQHSFGVAWLCWILQGQQASAALLINALAHDVAEHQTGDVPSPTRRGLCIDNDLHTMEAEAIQVAGLNIPALSINEVWVLLLADKLDGLLSCLEERELGNRHQGIETCFDNYHRAVGKLLNEKPHAIGQELLQLATVAWEELSR